MRKKGESVSLRQHYRMPWHGSFARLGAMKEWRPVHWAGVLVILAALTAGLVGLAANSWPSGPERWWTKLLETYWWYFLLAVMIGMALTVSWRRSRPKRHQ